MESKVAEVVGVAKKKDGSEIRGVKNGKSWVLMRVRLENDITLNMFAPVEVGDEVIELVQDPEYKSWKGKIKKASKSIARVPDMSDASMVLLTQILDELKKINENLTGRKSASKPVSQFDAFVAAKEELKDNIIDDVPEEPIDLDSIPF